MNIGYDAKRAFLNRTGLGNYSRDLIDLMAEKAVIPTLFSPTKSSETNWTPPKKASIIVPTRNSFLWRTYGMYHQARELPLDLYHGLSHEIPLSIKKFPCPSLVTMHDLIYKRYPQYFGWWDRQIYNLKWRWSVHAADHIVAISKSTADDLVKFFRVPSDKITVIYNCVSAQFQPEESPESVLPPDIPEKEFALFLGQHNERKNLDLLIRAYETAAKDLPPLVVIGAGNGLTFSNSVAQERITPLSGPFSGSVLAAIVRRARMVVYPSRFEGFGLPILEAMQSGTPVISCRNSSLPEVGGDAILYTSADDENELVDHMQRVWKDESLYRDLRQAGLDRAQLFSRERHQSEMLELYEKLIP